MNESSSVGVAQDDKAQSSFTWFLVKVVLIVLAFRSFVFAPFTIPSESMLPVLWHGDYLVAAKWPYGYSRWSLPFAPPLIPGRIFADVPEGGDVVIFKHPLDGSDYIKRAIGLPGDVVAMRDGQLIINGSPVSRRRIADFVVPLSPNNSCAGSRRERGVDGEVLCRYDRFVETLPSGRSYEVLDFGNSLQDHFGPVTVPPGKLFVMGDNRDNSQDSRFDVAVAGGVGMIDLNLLVGRAEMVAISADGTAQWYNPLSWFSAIRWHRIGTGI